MTGFLTNIDDLRKWFYGQGVPFFNLRYWQPGKTGETIMRNDEQDDMGAAWAMLSEMVASLSRTGRSMLNLIVYEKGKANNYKGFVNLDLSPTAQGQQVHGIGSLPAPQFDEAKIQAILEKEREKWELKNEVENLKAQLKSPVDWTDKAADLIEKIGNTPLGHALAAGISKAMGVTLPPFVQGPHGQADSDTGAADTFDEDISAVASTLGTDDVTLAKKLRRLVEQNPELAKSFLQ